MGEPASGTRPSDKPSEERLDSWKEIAAYLGRDVTTVQRWEKREGMPVHRHVHDKRGSVYALGYSNSFRPRRPLPWTSGLTTGEESHQGPTVGSSWPG